MEEVFLSNKQVHVKCPHCGYEWETWNRSGPLKCGKCHRPFPNPYSPNPGQEVKCPYCGHSWVTRSKMNTVLCNKCFKQFEIRNHEIPIIVPVENEIIKVICSKCGHKWEYHGNRKLGELDTCPFCNQLTQLKLFEHDVVAIDLPKYSGQTKINFGAIFTKYEPEFKILMEKYQIDNESAVKTAMKLFSVLINHFENNSFSTYELEQLVQISKQAELPAITVIAQDRLNKMEKSEKDKVILDFLLKK